VRPALRLVATWTVGIIVCTLIGCAGQPATPQPNVSDFVDVTFYVETRDAIDLPTVRKVQLTVLTSQSDGRPGNYVDPTSGATVPGPVIMERRTPWVLTVTMGPNIVSASVTAVLFGENAESIRCRAEINGLPIPGAGGIDANMIIGGPNAGLGAATARCFHLI